MFPSSKLHHMVFSTLSLPIFFSLVLINPHRVTLIFCVFERGCTAQGKGTTHKRKIRWKCYFSFGKPAFLPLKHPFLFLFSFYFLLSFLSLSWTPHILHLLLLYSHQHHFLIFLIHSNDMATCSTIPTNSNSRRSDLVRILAA